MSQAKTILLICVIGILVHYLKAFRNFLVSFLKISYIKRFIRRGLKTTGWLCTILILTLVRGKMGIRIGRCLPLENGVQATGTGIWLL